MGRNNGLQTDKYRINSFNNGRKYVSQNQCNVRKEQSNWICWFVGCFLCIYGTEQCDDNDHGQNFHCDFLPFRVLKVCNWILQLFLIDKSAWDRHFMIKICLQLFTLMLLYFVFIRYYVPIRSIILSVPHNVSHDNVMSLEWQMYALMPQRIEPMTMFAFS